MARYSTLNVDFGRKWTKHRSDIREALKSTDVLAAQELRRLLWPALRSVAFVHQPRRNRKQAGSEAIFVARRRGVRIIRRGSIRASWRKFGQRIGPRRLPWLLLDDPDICTPVLAICYHRAPKRMQKSRIDETQDKRLRGLVKWAEREGWEWVVLGDMNQLERSDPADLRRLHRGTWHGERIDLACVSPGLRVEQISARQDPRRRDKHPLVTVNVKENR